MQLMEIKRSQNLTLDYRITITITELELQLNSKLDLDCLEFYNRC